MSCLGVHMEKVEAEFMWEWGLLGEYARGTGCKGLGIWEVGVTVVESEYWRDKDRWGPTGHEERMGH